ncbi:hypothetical protein B0H14DRAFT_2804408 [Mycena olivaceomarginata]|nr:hypothetical protein B0H14DRAFT_2804408 [Mycena olivaceomarginata]
MYVVRAVTVSRGTMTAGSGCGDEIVPQEERVMSVAQQRLPVGKTVAVLESRGCTRVAPAFRPYMTERMLRARMRIQQLPSTNRLRDRRACPREHHLYSKYPPPTRPVYILFSHVPPHRLQPHGRTQAARLYCARGHDVSCRRRTHQTGRPSLSPRSRPPARASAAAYRLPPAAPRLLPLLQSAAPHPLWHPTQWAEHAESDTALTMTCCGLPQAAENLGYS